MEPGSDLAQEPKTKKEAPSRRTESILSEPGFLISIYGEDLLLMYQMDRQDGCSEPEPEHLSKQSLIKSDICRFYFMEMTAAQR